MKPDARTELARLADEVERTHVFPTHSWSKRDVSLRKLLDAARRHECPADENTRAALFDACWCMNHLGEVLNGMDAAGEDPQLAELSERMKRANAAAFALAAGAPRTGGDHG